ncbi:Protein CBG26589 [Caenorhabditis briggsae]|uniref:Protein CBG26589 n=1 Tax=Caenorhabditis briggsae TaxID=6238 RepID=B6IIE9_CAEBR|nr:Protein CBG26589 [Caenorhabditis briggsae]CAR99679.1 Protein CBG26589 [Caenorhabditis briggsae]
MSRSGHASGGGKSAYRLENVSNVRMTYQKRTETASMATEVPILWWWRWCSGVLWSGSLAESHKMLFLNTHKSKIPWVGASWLSWWAALATTSSSDAGGCRSNESSDEGSSREEFHGELELAMSTCVVFSLRNVLPHGFPADYASDRFWKTRRCQIYIK